MNLIWQDYVDLVLLVVNVEVDFVGPQCIWPSFNGVQLFYLQLAVPFILIFVFTLIWYFETRFFKNSITLARAMENNTMNKTCIRDGTIIPSDWTTVIIKRSLIAFSFTYQVITYRTFSTFSCQDFPDGSFMTSLPDIKCGSADHAGMVVVSVLYIIFVILAFPVAMLWVLLKARAENRLTEPAFALRFGTFYEQYKVECVWWEIVVLVRKFCISIILALISLPMIQGAVTILLIYFAIWLELSHLPYLEQRHNLLETVCLFCAMIYVIGGMIFYPSLNSSPLCIGTDDTSDATCSSTYQIKEGMSIALIILVVLTVGLAIALALWEVYERRQSRLASGYIASKEMGKDKIDIDSFVNSGSTTDMDEDLAVVQLHLSHMLNGCFLAAWKDWLIEMKARADNIELKYGIKNASSIVIEQLKVYVKLDKVIPFSACRFRDELSPASNSDVSGVTLDLMSVFPGLIDFMFTASDGVRTGVFDFLESFMLFKAKNPRLQYQGVKTDCEQVTVAEYRPVIAHWLMTSNVKGISRFRRFIQLLGSDIATVDPTSSPPTSRYYRNIRLKSGFRRFSTESREHYRGSLGNEVEKPIDDGNTDLVRFETDLPALYLLSNNVDFNGSSPSEPRSEVEGEISFQEVGEATLYEHSTELTASMPFGDSKTEPNMLCDDQRTGSREITKITAAFVDVAGDLKNEAAALGEGQTSKTGSSWEHCTPRRLKAVMAAGRSSQRHSADKRWEQMIDPENIDSQGPQIFGTPRIVLDPPLRVAVASGLGNSDIENRSEFYRAWQSMNMKLRATWRSMTPR